MIQSTLITFKSIFSWKVKLHGPNIGDGSLFLYKAYIIVAIKPNATHIHCDPWYIRNNRYKKKK